MEEHSQNSPAFAPDDPLDGRDILEWESKYPESVRRDIRNEAVYLLIMLGLCPVLILFLWLWRELDWLALSDNHRRIIWTYGTGWLTGTLGGTLFSLKWLYHSAARQIWHRDRRCWRFLTPHISGGLSFVMLAMVASGLLAVFDRDAMRSGSAIVGFCFLVGYFSDSAIGKLSDLADTLFGSRSRAANRRDVDSDGDDADKGGSGG